MNKGHNERKYLKIPSHGTIGRVLFDMRNEHEMEREEVAKRLKINPSYIAQIERNDPVSISPRIVAGLEKLYKKSLKKFAPKIEGHNYFVNRYRKEKRNTQ